MNTNPFTFGNPIRDPSRFFGHTKEIRQIVSRLLSSAHESTAIVGERRLGKTSLLNYLCHGEVMPSLGLMPDKFCLVYIDFQGLTDITPQRFWQRVLLKTSRTVSAPDLGERFNEFSTRSQFDLFDLEDLFALVADHGLNIVLLLDEFEYVTQNPHFGSDFFGGLRALAIHSNLALITATRRELVDLCHSDLIKGSPFFNIFANVVLMPLSAGEAEEMVKAYLKRGALPSTPDDHAFILEMGGGHPYLLQIAGYHWYEVKAQGLQRESLYSAASERICEQAEPHFRYLWSLLSDSEKGLLIELLGDLAGGMEVEKLSAHPGLSQGLLRSMLRRGLAIKTGESVSLISPALAHFLRQRSEALKVSATQSEHGPARGGVQRGLPGYDVFISYSTLDRKTADAIVAGLEERGLRCWIAPRDVLPGMPYGQAIITAMNQCKAMIVVFSSSANASEQVMQEVERGVSKRMTIMPLRIENEIPTGAMELFLSARHWLDALEPPFQSTLDQLAQAIRALEG
jgi:hypothetical protein